MTGQDFPAGVPGAPAGTQGGPVAADDGGVPPVVVGATGVDEKAELRRAVQRVEALHRPRTFEAHSDHHHEAALKAVGSISPYRHDCTAECFEWVTICDHDGHAWPCDTVAALAGGVS